MASVRPDSTGPRPLTKKIGTPPCCCIPDLLVVCERRAVNAAQPLSRALRQAAGGRPMAAPSCARTRRRASPAVVVTLLLAMSSQSVQFAPPAR